MAPVPNWSNARSQMRSLSGEVVWETQTTCAIVHFGPKPPPTTASRGPQRSRDFGPERKSLLVDLLALPEQQTEDHGQDHRENDARRDRDVDGHVAALEGDVAGEVEAPEEHQAAPDDGQQDAENQEHPADVLHGLKLRGSEQARLPLRRLLAEVLIGQVGCHPSARGPSHEADLDQVRLVHVLDRLGLLRQRYGDGVEPDRAPLELLDQRLEQAAVERLQAEIVDVEHRESGARGLDRRAAVAANLGVVAHAPQQAVCDAGCAAGAPGDLRDRLRLDLDLENARRPPHDALQLGLGIEVQPVHGAEAVAQRSAEQTLTRGGPDAGEVRQW